MITSNLNDYSTNKYHCEKNGKETSIEKTRVLTKINGIINLKLFQNPEIDFEQKTILSLNKPPIKFFTKINTPPDLKEIIGDLFATVEDSDEPEQSTCILSDEGIKYLMGSQLIKLIPHLKNYELIKFPEKMFFVSANNTDNFNPQTKKCENCGINYPSVGKKYMSKLIFETYKETIKLGHLQLSNGILKYGFDVAFSDVSEKNPNGTLYQFKTDNNFKAVNLCSNECSIEYCNKNNCIIYYIDLMNGGKMRILSKYTPDINEKLQNLYKFRSSSI
jgi:hypothetical protein